MNNDNVHNLSWFFFFYLVTCVISILTNVILLVPDPEKLFRCSVVFISLRYDLSNFLARQFIIIWDSRYAVILIRKITPWYERGGLVIFNLISWFEFFRHRLRRGGGAVAALSDWCVVCWFDGRRRQGRGRSGCLSWQSWVAWLAVSSLVARLGAGRRAGALARTMFATTVITRWQTSRDKNLYS